MRWPLGWTHISLRWSASLSAASRRELTCATQQLPIFTRRSHIIAICRNSGISRHWIGGGVNIDRSKLSWFHLTQHSLAHLVMFYILGFAYGCKLPPRTAKTVFANPKAPPFGFEKIFFFKSPKIIFLAKPFNRNRSHDSKKVWHLGIRNIFGNIFLKNIFKNIFSKNIYKNIFNTQVLYHFGILRPIPIEWLC